MEMIGSIEIIQEQIESTSQVRISRPMTAGDVVKDAEILIDGQEVGIHGQQSAELQPGGELVQGRHARMFPQVLMELHDGAYCGALITPDRLLCHSYGIVLPVVIECIPVQIFERIDRQSRWVDTTDPAPEAPRNQHAVTLRTFDREMALEQDRERKMGQSRSGLTILSLDLQERITYFALSPEFECRTHCFQPRRYNLGGISNLHFCICEFGCG